MSKFDETQIIICHNVADLEIKFVTLSNLRGDQVKQALFFEGYIEIFAIKDNSVWKLAESTTDFESNASMHWNEVMDVAV